MRPNIENFIGCDSSYRAASIVLYGAPYDSTTSYRPGARFGPAAIRHESYGLETYSPYQNADLTDFDVFDSGDLEPVSYTHLNMAPDMAASHIPFQLVPKLQ